MQSADDRVDGKVLGFVEALVDHDGDERSVGKEPAPCSETERYLTTPKAAAFLHRSTSWLLRQKDIAYLRGRPNVYDVRDLMDWFEKNKHRPMI